MNRWFDVFVPVTPALTPSIGRGSAIVGEAGQLDAVFVKIYVESNTHKTANLLRFADRVIAAANIGVKEIAASQGKNAPPTSLMAFPKDSLRRVATYELGTQALTVSDQPALDHWMKD